MSDELEQAMLNDGLLATSKPAQPMTDAIPEDVTREAADIVLGFAKDLTNADAMIDCFARALLSAEQAATERERERPGWHPISTAPMCVPSSPGDRGLRPVLVTRWPITGEHRPIAVARLTVDGWIVGRGGPWRKKLWFEPTHWFSLDDLPQIAVAIRQDSEGK